MTSFFNLVLAYNKGAAFSFLSNESGWQRYFFTAVGIIAVVFIVSQLRKHADKRLFCWSFSLIMGGAVGVTQNDLDYSFQNGSLESEITTLIALTKSSVCISFPRH